MKAIFAVTALAAAISAQAIAADTEITTTANGAMDVNFILDMNADPATYDVDLKEDDFNYGLKYNVAVANGPFTGSLFFEAKDQVGTPATIEVKDLIVTDGAISFGQVGSLMNTDQYVESINEDMSETKLDVDVAFRYTISDEFKVQLQGLNNDTGTATGVAAAYKAEAGALAYAVEAESYFSANDTDTPAVVDDITTVHVDETKAAVSHNNGHYFAGAGVTYTSDVVKLLAAVNASAVNADADAVIEYAVAAESTFGPASVKASYQDFSTDAKKDEIAKVEAAVTFDAITASTGYKYTLAEKAGDEVWVKGAWAADNKEASAKVILGEFDADTAADPKLELRASMKNAVGITYYGEFDFQTDLANKLTLGAKYSF